MLMTAGVAAPVFAHTHAGGLAIAVADAQSMPSTNDRPEKTRPGLAIEARRLDTKLDQYNRSTTCSRQYNLVTGWTRVCTVENS